MTLSSYAGSLRRAEAKDRHRVGDDERRVDLAGLDVEPAVDPHHLPVAAEGQVSSLTDVVAVRGQFLGRYLAQPIVEPLAQVCYRPDLDEHVDLGAADRRVGVAGL